MPKLQTVPVTYCCKRLKRSICLYNWPPGRMGCKGDKPCERGRGVAKCVSAHWVTLLLNLSTSKVSPQGWGLDGRAPGVVGGKVSQERVREKGEMSELTED